MNNADSYLRVSGKSQVDDDGFPRQRKAIERYGYSRPKLDAYRI